MINYRQKNIIFLIKLKIEKKRLYNFTKEKIIILFILLTYILKNNTIRIKINVELDNNYMDIQKDINFTFPNKLKNKIRFGIYITNLKGGGAQRVTALLLNYIQDIKIFDIFLFTLNIVEKGEYKTPDKIKTKPLKKSKIKTKDYKHKATSKKIMVTKITDIFNLNNSPIIKENKNNNIFPNSFPNNNNPINKKKQNINSNSIYNNYNYSYSKKITEYINKENCGSEQKFSQNNFSSTLGQKINIITYNLEEKEIQCLKTMPKFEYKGDLKNSLNDYDILYSSASVIIIDKSKSKYDWKIYEFFLDKKILIDFASFLFEFMTERADEDIIDAKNTLDTLNKISINEETYFFNKNIRYKKRSLLNSIKIVENISEHKKEKNEKINENNKIFNFAINKNIIGGEKRVLHKIIKVYLKANIIKMEPPKRSQSVGPSMKFKFKTEYINNEKKENLFMIQKKNENTNLNKIEENKIEEDIEINNEEKNETKEIKGDTYLISREKIVNRGLIRNIPNFKDVISYKYVFDSFLAGELINLNDNNILKKYQFT